MKSEAGSASGPRRLEGVHVLVTRPRDRSQDLCFLLEDEGAAVECVPLLELLPPQDLRPLQYAAEHIDRYQWILFASPSAVQAVMEALRLAGTTERLSRTKIGAVGPKTAKAVEGYGFEVAREASIPSGSGLLEALKELISPEDEVLLPTAEDGRTELGDGLVARGAVVTRIAAYRSTPVELDAPVLERLRTRAPGPVLFGSPRTFDAFLEALGEDARRICSVSKLIAIGPTTAAAIEQQGMTVAAIAARPSVEDLVEATISAMRG